MESLTWTKKLYMKILQFSCYLVPHGIDDSSVAFQRDKHNSVGRGDEKTPERSPSEPKATDELITGTVTRHVSTIHLDNSRHQCQERRTHVYDALIHDQNVDFLKTIDT